jgi:hypothetical protein
VNLSLKVTPEIKLSLPMNFSSLSVFVSAIGNGDLQFSIDADNPFSIKGDYSVENGYFEIDYLNLISRKLNLERGSSLSWTGDPADATLNINGVYAQRVSLSSLTGYSEGLDDVSQKTVNVESVISLTGKLANPRIKFDFRLPNADQSTEEEVYSLIDRSNEREMVNQTISLLLQNQFLPISGTTSDGILGNGLTTGVEFLTNQVSSIVTGMIKFVDVNLQYRSQTELSSDQLNIDISKEWNKFYFETNFGWGGNARSVGLIETDNTLVGDMLLGYKINPYLHVIVFNRSNVNDYTKQNLPYTQGVGLKYTHSFDTWKNFFGKKKMLMNKNSNSKINAKTKEKTNGTKR